MRITLDDSEVKQPELKERKIKRVKEPTLKKRGEESNVKKATKIIFTIVGILFTVFIAYAGYLVYKAYKAGTEIGLKLKPSDVISQELATLKKDSTGKRTNALIVGIDTREGGNLLNTDTIILVSYDHDNNNVTMLSIPRDFHVQIDPDLYWFKRINSVYSAYEQKGEGQGLLRLRDVVSEITGIEIQYHAMIDFKGFTELIDSLGGINVNVENSFTDYRYPTDTGRKTVSFEAGPQLMDGVTALEYARSRHSLDNNEGSDFARARRQQKVITAVTDEIVSSSLLDPQSLMSLFNVIQDNVKISDFTLNDIEAGVKELKEFREKGETYSFVLDPTAGAGQLVTSKNVVNTGAYAIGPIAGLGNYEDIQSYIQEIWSTPQLYEEDPVIRAYNIGRGYTESRNKYLELKEQFPYLKTSYMGTLYNDKVGTVVYVNAEEGFNHSLDVMNTFLEAESTEKPEYIKTRLNAEDITILFGKEIVSEDNTQETE